MVNPSPRAGDWGIWTETGTDTERNEITVGKESSREGVSGVTSALPGKKKDFTGSGKDGVLET